LKLKGKGKRAYSHVRGQPLEKKGGKGDICEGGKSNLRKKKVLEKAFLGKGGKKGLSLRSRWIRFQRGGSPKNKWKPRGKTRKNSGGGGNISPKISLANEKGGEFLLGGKLTDSPGRRTRGGQAHLRWKSVPGRKRKKGNFG